ncbi:MAG: hypothetical protein HOY71_34380 [Nonomuraea sp.]|nr:hypothetical protein [Nonomuraea sp.]
MDVREDDLPITEAAELPVEASEADAAEQARQLRDQGAARRFEVPIDVDPADAFEQSREVAVDDEDDYR